MFVRPPFQPESIPLDSLKFPPSCQQRAGLPTEQPKDKAILRACWQPDDSGKLVCVADPKAAEHLAELIREGAQPDPLEVVRERADGKRVKQDRYWVFGGFTRGAAYKLFGKFHSVPCNVYEGTYQDALFWSLSENHKNIQTRGHGSAKRSVETLLDTPLLMERVRERVSAFGGLAKAIAAACQVSYATVCNVIAGRDLSIEGTRLVPRQPKPVTVPAAPHSDGGSGSANIDTPLTPVETTQPGADATEDEAPERDEGEPLYTVPADYAGPGASPAAAAQPDAITSDGLILEAKNGIAAERARIDQIIRHAQQLDEMLRQARGGMAGRLLDGATYQLAPLFQARRVRERKAAGTEGEAGTVERAVEFCAAPPSVLVDVLRRLRPKRICAGCRGEKCPACKMLGFVPADESLIAGETNLRFEFGDPPAPWDEGGAE